MLEPRANFLDIEFNWKGNLNIVRTWWFDIGRIVFYVDISKL